jgi:hypothetical protein
MVKAFCASGNHESVKGGVHGAVGALVAVCAIYNVTAWWFRRERHLRVNAIVYTLATAWELKQTLHHVTALRRCMPHPPERCEPPAGREDEAA